MTRTSRRWLVRSGAAFAVALALVSLVAGCGRPPAALPAGELERLGALLTQIQAASPQETAGLRRNWDDQLRRLRAQEQPNQAEIARLEFAVAYAFEREEQYREAVAAYAPLARGPLGVLAGFRIGEIQALGFGDIKQATGQYNHAAMALPAARLWVRQAPDVERPLVADRVRWPSVLASAPRGRLALVEAQEAAQLRLDLLQRDDWRYRAISVFVKLLGDNPRYSHALALMLIALIVKVVTWPLTSSSFRSIRAMQSLQPLIKELQEKHKGDRQALAGEQMRLFKKYKINPLGGCLPMLIQMPILIGVYYGIRFYIYQFRQASFVWIESLAQPDMPLLLLYAVSLYLSQKLTMTPTADPQQQQMQRTMTIMMPLMLTVLFASLPSAFILYWMFYNVLITAHQYLLMRQPLPLLAAAKEPEPPGPGPGSGPRRSRRKRKK